MRTLPAYARKFLLHKCLSTAESFLASAQSNTQLNTCAQNQPHTRLQERARLARIALDKAKEEVANLPHVEITMRGEVWDGN